MAKSYCDDCFFCGRLDGGSTPYCKYYFMTNQRRPCPGGEGCTAKVPRKVYRRNKKTEA